MKKALLFLIVILTSLYSSENDYLSDTQKDLLDTSKKSAKQTAQKNKKIWLNDANINASTSQNNEDIRTDDVYINWDQDIFKFGGIKYKIEYAKVKESYDILGVDIEEKSLLSNLFEILMDIKIIDLEIEQTKLNIKNKEITVAIRKDSYSAGNVDISELNDAIMDKNALEDTLVALKAEKSRYINSLKELTDMPYKNIDFPKIDMIDKDEYVNKSTTLKHSKLDIEAKNYTAKITDTDYLPSVKVNLRYGHNEIEKSSNDGEYYKYGVSLSMPLSFTASNSKQISRLEYIKAKQELAQNKKSVEVQYQSSLINIQSYKEKKEIALKDIELYDSLLELCESEYKVGYRPIEDVLTLRNTKNIRELDIKINELNIKKELLGLYFDMM